MTDFPKPGPPVASSSPLRAVRPADTAPAPGQGLPDHEAEARRRLVFALIPYQRDADQLIDIAEWILHGEDSS